MITPLNVSCLIKFNWSKSVIKMVHFNIYSLVTDTIWKACAWLIRHGIWNASGITGGRNAWHRMCDGSVLFFLINRTQWKTIWTFPAARKYSCPGTLPAVSWAVWAARTDAGSPRRQMRPMSNANHGGWLCPFVRCTSQITLRQRAPAQQRAPRQCAQNCNCNSNVSRHAARAARYITARNLSMNTSMRQRLWISRLHRQFIKQPSHWKI